jgi:predicted AAA+ superfamily ATPase
MRPIDRELGPRLRRAANAFPALVVTGPRRAGKTFCLRHTFPKASYQLLEEPDVVAAARSDPRAWLESLALPVIIDEIQHAPDLLPWIRARIDQAPSQHGRWLITGSQDFGLMRGVSESMAGRAAVFSMLPLSMREVGRWDLLRGGYPEVWAHPRVAADWFRSYLQTYLERDVRDVTQVKDLGTFRRFLALAAARNAQILNKTELAAPLGVSVPTIGQWIDVLETTGIVTLVQPYFENFEKRLLKTPKLYFNDTGLLCHLLGITTLSALERSAFIGPVFETFIATELAKLKIARGEERALYFFRDQQGLEVDFLNPTPDGKLELIEAKWTKTPLPAMARGIRALLDKLKDRGVGLVVSRRAAGRPEVSTLAAGVKAITVEALLG